jgi:dTDP-4-amino-4,6-dideoxy-D-galactose acyltransferase
MSKIDESIESYPHQDPDETLLQLGYLAGLYSRFKADSNITEEQFKKVYSLWMNNSTNRKIAQEVFVIEKQNKHIAMITLGEKNNCGDIGLLAVDPQFHGQQLGTKLVQAAQLWALNKGFKFGQVVTQQTNLPACALYEKCGYSIENIENFYHFWLK